MFQNNFPSTFLTFRASFNKSIFCLKSLVCVFFLNKTDNNDQNELSKTFAAFYLIIQIILTIHKMSLSLKTSPSLWLPWCLFSCHTLWSITESTARRCSENAVKSSVVAATVVVAHPCSHTFFRNSYAHFFSF